MPLQRAWPKKFAGICLAGCWLVTHPSFAGPLGGIVALPGQVLGGVGQSAGQIGGDLNTTLGAAQRDLVGRPSAARTFDRDLSGARVLRRTIIVIAPTDSDLAAAKQLRFEIVQTFSLSSLSLTVVQLRTPSGMPVTDALAALRKADPSGSFDYDHIYDPSGSARASAGERKPSPVTTINAHAARIGMIDGGVARHHASLSDASIVSKNVAGVGEGPATAHGTAIASLLVGNDDDFHGCLVGATLYAADVYGGQASGGGAIEIVRALDWLSQNNVPVVNVSLAGPDNKLLELAVKRFLTAGGIIVAAVGNAGPAAPLAYPAAYAGVVGVTAVDSQRHLQIDANRGDVTFAALGVGVRAAKPDRGYATYTGTSFAAPIVAARFALLLSHPEPQIAQRALNELRRAAAPVEGDRAAIGYGYLAPPSGVALTANK